MGKLRFKVVRRLLALVGGLNLLLVLAGIYKIAPPSSKGNQVNIPEPGCGYWGGGQTLLQPFVCRKVCRGVNCGNANEFGDASGSPGKSYLFFLT